MTEINKVLRKATGRLMIERLLRGLVLCLLVASCAVVGARLGERFLAYTLDWRLAWIIACSAGVVAAVVWTLVTRQSRLAVARVVDERAGLKEAISTALCVESSEDAWSRAARDHAQEVSRRVVLRDVVPVRAPRGWFAPLVLLGVFFALGLVPQSDLLGLTAEREKQAEQKKEVLQAEAQSKEAEEILAKVDSLLDVNDGAGAEEPLVPEAPELSDPMEIRRDAMAKLTSAQERLDQMQNGAEAKGLEALREKMAMLKQPGPGPLESLSKALQNGEFGEAQKQLNELTEKLSKGELSEQDKKTLEKQLQDLAEQLEKLAEEQGALEKKLQQMGLDPKLAQSPQQLQQAIEQAMHLTPEQKEMLKSMCQSASQCQSMCQSLASACSSASAGGMSESERMAQMAQLADKLGEIDEQALKQALAQLSQQQIQAQLDKLSQCMGQCEGGSLASLNPGNSPGGKKAGWGKGNNTATPQTENFNTDKRKLADSKSDTNIMLGSEYVQDGQIRGESRAEFAEAVRAASVSASEEIDNNQIPREFHEAIKKYFGALEESATPAAQDAPSGGGSE